MEENENAVCARCVAANVATATARMEGFFLESVKLLLRRLFHLAYTQPSINSSRDQEGNSLPIILSKNLKSLNLLDESRYVNLKKINDKYRIVLSFFTSFFNGYLMRQLPWQQEQGLGQMLPQPVTRVAPQGAHALRQAELFF